MNMLYDWFQHNFPWVINNPVLTGLLAAAWVTYTKFIGHRNAVKAETLDRNRPHYELERNLSQILYGACIVFVLLLSIFFGIYYGSGVVRTVVASMLAFAFSAIALLPLLRLGNVWDDLSVYWLTGAMFIGALVVLHELGNYTETGDYYLKLSIAAAFVAVIIIFPLYKYVRRALLWWENNYTLGLYGSFLYFVFVFLSLIAAIAFFYDSKM
ncbi:hypothetical protein [Methylobacterium sp. 1973]|uniref:hypothetical protein n=1 Tax=Methylobacterium sp. 1973 TaxID=3156421 RepID=UPI0033939D31